MTRPARRTSTRPTRPTTRSWTSAAVTCTSFGTRRPPSHRPSPCSWFRPAPRDGWTPRIPATAPSDRGHVLTEDTRPRAVTEDLGHAEVLSHWIDVVGVVSAPARLGGGKGSDEGVAVRSHPARPDPGRQPCGRLRRVEQPDNPARSPCRRDARGHGPQ